MMASRIPSLKISPFNPARRRFGLVWGVQCNGGTGERSALQRADLQGWRSAPYIQINGLPGDASLCAVAQSIDEVRISNVARSAGWIATQYANQINPSAFSTVGPIY